MKPATLSNPEGKEIRKLCATPQRMRLRKAFCDLAKSIEPTAFITLATNQSYSINKMQKLIMDFFARLDRKLLGSDWAKKPTRMRTQALVCIEHVETNIHAHCAANLPRQHVWQQKPICESIWQTLCPSGSVALEVRGNRSRQIGYITKEMTDPRYDWEEQVMVLPPFKYPRKP